MSVTYNFGGKRILVTGGASGLGRGIVAKFLSSGATVIALDRDAVRLSELKMQFPSVETICVDLLDWEGSKKAVERATPIHHLVNNAGIPQAEYFESISPESIDKVFGINFKASINLSQVVAKGISENKLSGGTIVNISSTLDSKCVRGTGMYSCTKAAVIMLTKVMAVELAPLNIRVNCVRPTIMETNIGSGTVGKVNEDTSTEVVKFSLERQLIKRFSTVEETADAVLYLSSDASSMINGSNILVDGGAYTTYTT